MTPKRMLQAAGLVAVFLIVEGCGGNYSSLNKNWGYSYDTAGHVQIMNLNAGKGAEPVTDQMTALEN
jgi:hypothetical protein